MFSEGAIVVWNQNRRVTGYVHESNEMVTLVEVFGDGFAMDYWSDDLTLSFRKHA